MPLRIVLLASKPTLAGMSVSVLTTHVGNLHPHELMSCLLARQRVQSWCQGPSAQLQATRMMYETMRLPLHGRIKYQESEADVGKKSTGFHADEYL